MEFANLVQCGNYAVADGHTFLGINMITSGSRYKSELAMAAKDLKEHQDLTGIGDEAVLLKDTTGYGIKPRYLLARKGDKGVILMPMCASKDVTDEMMTKMLATVVSHM